MKPLNKIKIKWSSNLAYAIGLITTDGNLSKDGRHINFTSKDKELAHKFIKCLGIKTKITMKSSGLIREKLYYFIQFGDVVFYRFLQSLGLEAKKSKIVAAIKIPDKYFFHFLRGHFDGDGTFYSYFDPRWRSSFMFYTVFISASEKHIKWLRGEIIEFLNIEGHIAKSKKHSCYHLKYAKKESINLLSRMYKTKGDIYLKRKYLKIKKALAIIGRQF